MYPAGRSHGPFYVRLDSFHTTVAWISILGPSGVPHCSMARNHTKLYCALKSSHNSAPRTSFCVHPYTVALPYVISKITFRTS